MKFLSSISNSEAGVPFRIAVRLTLLLILATGIYAVVAKYAGFAHPHRYLVRLQHLAESRPDVILFGDSTLFWVDKYSDDKRSLERRISDALPGEKVGSVSKATLNPEMYLEGWHYLRKHGANPRAVVLMLNLSAFSSTLYLRPDSEFPKLRYQMYWDNWLSRALYRPLAIFDAVDPQPLDPFSYAQLQRAELAGAPPSMGLPETPRAAVETGEHALTFREHLYLRYGAPQPGNHPSLRALVALVEALRREDIGVFLYLTPIDMARGRMELGADFDQSVAHNRQNIHAALEPFIARDPGVWFYDGLELLPSEAFMHNRGPPDEHLYEMGLTSLFDALHPYLVALLSGDASLADKE